VATVVPAFMIGTWLIFFSTKGAPWHRALGRIFMVLMIVTAISAIFIKAVVGPTYMGFGLIHLFVILTVFGIFNAIRGLQTGNIARHKSAVLGVYAGAILIAGAFTFVPGRIMYEIVFS
jgi:uncharacterized membrane protein